jgi:hypothetical protein
MVMLRQVPIKYSYNFDVEFTGLIAELGGIESRESLERIEVWHAKRMA